MDKAKPFDDYFTDVTLAPDRRDRLTLMRQMVHDMYPDVAERVSYAMPGFYPANPATGKPFNAQQMLFLFMANKNWLGIYGVPGLVDGSDDGGFLEMFAPHGVTSGKGSLHVPYNMPTEPFETLLRAVIDYNLTRLGLDPLPASN
jgi:uncharacterized protein YdhG (YjbR/CyaY superfamily)